MANSVLNMDGCIAVLIGHGMAYIADAPCMKKAYLWCWSRGRLQETWLIAHRPGTRINTKELFGDLW
eukprot:3145224-Heterocapsa_arctica.AAC.1